MDGFKNYILQTFVVFIVVLIGAFIRFLFYGITFKELKWIFLFYFLLMFSGGIYIFVLKG
ncbi:hypothetical protein DYE49_11995 [Treponema rectale]|uniref:Uncharacterized protein n=1 Tax=Treponema rectale TaxID=744512 RepID=A0A7M1XPR7_9SPIR|nr:hypothetical protein DYE49_11995 [Treponema rectale]